MHGFDGARDFSFERALVGDMFRELARAEACLVEELETGFAASGEALGCQLHARAIDLVGGHQNRTAVLGEFVRHVHLAQGGDDGTAVMVVQIGEKDTVIGCAAPQQKHDDQGDCGRRGADLKWFRSEEHTSELQSLMRISYAVFCLKKKTHNNKLHKRTM